MCPTSYAAGIWESCLDFVDGQQHSHHHLIVWGLLLSILQLARRPHAGFGNASDNDSHHVRLQDNTRGVLLQLPVVYGYLQLCMAVHMLPICHVATLQSQQSTSRLTVTHRQVHLHLQGKPANSVVA